MRALTILSLFLIGVCTSAQPGHGQDQAAGTNQRLTYSVKHGKRQESGRRSWRSISKGWLKSRPSPIRRRMPC